MEKRKLFLFLVLVLSVIGMADSIHLLEIKYGGHEFIACDINEKFSCSTVNMSPQSEFFGFPTAGIGLIGYSVLAMMSFFLLRKKDWRDKFFHEKLFNLVTPFTLLIVAAIGLIMQLYYTYVEFFVLEQFCIFCLFSQALIIGIAVFAYVNFSK